LSGSANAGQLWLGPRNGLGDRFGGGSYDRPLADDGKDPDPETNQRRSETTQAQA
jgi:hypothetical protein